MLIGYTVPFSFDQPAWLWLSLLIPVMVILSIKSLAGLDPLRKSLSLLARSLVILIIVLCLSGINTVRTNDDLTVMYLMDRSESVPEDIQQTQEDFIIKASKDCAAHDRVGMIDFARHAYVEQPPYEGNYYLSPGQLPDIPNADRTDIAAAIRMAMAIFPHDTSRRIVLLTDGNDNMGDVLREAANAKANGAVIDIVPLWYQHGNEIFFDRMVAPASAEEGEQVPIRLVVNSKTRSSGQLVLIHNDRAVKLPDEYNNVRVEPGDNVFIVKMPIQSSGPQRFEARFIPSNPKADSISENNVATAFTFVSGKSKVLILSSNTLYDAPLADALTSENVNVELRAVDDGTMDLLEMMNYSAIVLANVPANVFTDEQQKMLASYVKDMGGGLIMTGGDEAFGAGGWTGSPLEEVMPVTFEVKHKKVIPRGALVIICHSCEIPRGNYWGKEVAKKSVDVISSRDYIGILAYTWSPGGVNWEVPIQLATNKSAVKQKIGTMQIGDMPDFASTMKMALKGLEQTDAAQKHVIIISDGDPSPPSASLLQKFKNQKITVSTVGIGVGSHVFPGPLKKIAKTTGGRYYLCSNPRVLPQIFVKESKVVRRSLINEDKFSPQIAFALDELLVGISPGDTLPPLQGMVLTSPKPLALVPLVRPTKEGSDPVLAHWQYELGKTVAFTSGMWPRWGANWVQWDNFSKLWAQIVRWSLKQEAPANFDVFTRMEGNKGRIVIEALDEDAGYLDHLRLPGGIIKPDQSVDPLTFTQTGPGHYEATFEIDQAGQYIANMNVVNGEENMGAIHTGLSVPYSPEFRELSTNEALLRQVQEITGGRWIDDIDNPRLANIFSHDLPPSTSSKPVWDWTLAWILLPLFLIDVAVRRLANWLAFSLFVEAILLVVLLFGAETIYNGLWGVIGSIIIAECVGWAIRFRYIIPMFQSITHTVTVLGHAGERSTASLGQLKETRDKVRTKQTAPHGTITSKQETPAPNRSARFDAGEKAEQGAVEDIHSALGGAKTQEEFKEKRRPPAPSEQDKKDQEDMTSRLLKAKRRARKDMDEEEK